jgi:integrase
VDSDSGFSVAGWLEHWLSVYAPVRCSSRKTIERYRSLARYLAYGPLPLQQTGSTKLEEIVHGELEFALLSLLSEGRQKAKLSPRTVRHLGSLLSVAFDKAFRLDLIPENPMRKVELPPLTKPEARCLSLEQMQALRRVCRYDWTGPLIELALATGARRGELLALECVDIEWGPPPVLMISKSLEQTAAGLRVKCPKSGKSRRCTLPQVAVTALLPRLRWRQEESKLLFPDPATGSHRSPSRVSKVISRRLHKAGIEDASLHTLRHTHASMLISRGVPLPAVSARLGHADPNITARIYAHALPPDDARAADVWDALLGEA